MYKKPSVKCHQKGVSLIEILIALLIVSGGLLALVRLQTTSLKTATSAVERSQAVLFAGVMMEQMRINSAGVDSGNYAVEFGELPNSGSREGDEIRAWKADLSAALAEGDGLVSLDANFVTVRVRWKERWSQAPDDDVAEVLLRSKL